MRGWRGRIGSNLLGGSPWQVRVPLEASSRGFDVGDVVVLGL